MPGGPRRPVAGVADASKSKPKPAAQGRQMAGGEKPEQPTHPGQVRLTTTSRPLDTSPTRQRKISRHFDKQPDQEQQQQKQHNHASPDPFLSMSAGNRAKPTSANFINKTNNNNSSSPRTAARSTSYASPLPILAEDADSGLGGGRASAQQPLTERNLQSLLRSLDKEEKSNRRPEAAAAGVPATPRTATATAATRRAHSANAAPPSPAVTIARPFPSPLPATGANSSSMRKSRSPKKHEKEKDKRKLKHYHDHDSDPDTHPLNLPPDQLRLHLLHMARQEAEAGRQSVSMDRDTPEVNGQNQDFSTLNGASSPPATPLREAPGAFPEQSETATTNGTNGHDDRSPTPPPHRVAPAPKVDPEACKAAGNKFFKAKDYERAIQEYTKAVEAEPSNPTYLSNRAAAYISANKYSQALGDSLQASRLDPNNDKILHRLARIYTSLGRPQDALDTYAKLPNASATDTAAARKALQSIDMAENQINSEDGNGNMALWSIEQARQTLGAGTPTPRRWQILKAKANLKVGSANSLGEVQGISQNLMRENPMDAEAIVLAGQAFYLKDDKPRQGKSDYERAEDYFRQALALDPDNAGARNCLRTMKKLDRARTAANDLFKRGRYSDAVAAYTEALTIDSTNKVTNAKLLGNRALARIKIKEYDEAKTDCDQALKLDPTYTKARKTRAKATGESGDWEQAVKDLKALVEENPSDSELNKELRNAELELKKSKRKDYYKILGIDKDAGDKDIERAYKRKAAVLHPDKTMGDKAKEEEFKDCLEAKETLLDPQKRQIYDSGADLMEPGMGMGGGGFPGGMHGFGGMGGGGGMQIDPEMLFNMMNGMGGAGGPGGGGFRFNAGGGRGGYSPFG